MTTLNPIVIDISHHNTLDPKFPNAFVPAYKFGIRAVIHKSSQGINYTDQTYHTRRELALVAGHAWGAYHFNGAGSVKDQVDYFMGAANPDADTLMALDWEDVFDNHGNPQFEFDLDHNQAKEFIQRLDDKLGRKCKFYSGNRAKEQLVKASDADLEFFVEHDLWLCQYSDHFVLPKGFTKFWLWQFTGDGSGPLPHDVPGIIAGNKGLDINHFDGTEDELKKSWV